MPTPRTYAGYKKKEGISVFFEFYVTDKQTLKTKYPEFYEICKRAINEGLGFNLIED